MAWSSRESLVEVISSMERSGSPVSGVLPVRRTRGHNFSGMSSRGDVGKLLFLEVLEALVEGGGRRAEGEFPLSPVSLKGESDAILLLRCGLPSPAYATGENRRPGIDNGPPGGGRYSRMMPVGG